MHTPDTILKLVYKREFFDVSVMKRGARLVTTINADVVLVSRTSVFEEVVIPVHVSVVLVLSVLDHSPWSVRMLGLVVTTDPHLIVVLIIVVCESHTLISLMEEV